MNTIELGKSTDYPDKYDASLLAPIPRSQARLALPTVEERGEIKFFGRDYWTAYELSWLNSKGVPQVAIAEFVFDASSDYIIESKSFKYYLNSFNQTCFDSWDEVEERLTTDLAKESGSKVKVVLFSLRQNYNALAELPGVCVDDLDCVIDQYQPETSLLQFDKKVVQGKQLYSHLLKSNCPVTGQPDWATLWIQYSGSYLNEQSFLKYLVGFRQYQGFHESCVERIYCDLFQQGELTELCVYARYTRRGGLDINPVRYSSEKVTSELPFGRLSRQ